MQRAREGPMALLRTLACPRAKREFKGASAVGFVLCGLLLSSDPNLQAQRAPVAEYQIKAVFLFNFAQFVDWPTNAFSEAQAPLVIGVLGEDPFGVYLDETVRGEKVNNRPVAVQ